eukprot:TRINITY_DN1009_c0_g1_i5.p1 TRINITY_DN1009_c0_g1~~TRINITY_DN1009_c0_g1_i5.p1  ORF type:complete len:287 (-),score=41.20 TRINITY_DN1009_c0_g1_i5:41-901(-)
MLSLTKRAGVLFHRRSFATKATGDPEWYSQYLTAEDVKRFRESERLWQKVREDNDQPVGPIQLGEEAGVRNRTGLPYTPVDLKSVEGFALALTYLTQNPPKSARDDGSLIDKRPGHKIREWTVEELLKLGRHTQVTAAGRVYSFSALVMLGTGRGTAGIGYGRGPTVVQATELARMNAEKNVLSLVLHRGNSVGKDLKCRYKKSWIRMKCARTGWGTNAGWDMKVALGAFGITDVSVKQCGSKNRSTRYRALFLGLRDGVRTKHQVSRILGRKLFNKQQVWYYSHE